ncbi:MAG: lipocalin-like domain-containing protein [Pseudomonadota bacterium]
MRASVLILIVVLLIAPKASGQGFADLGADAEEYSQVTPGQTLVFPADHGAHPGFRIEWWYLTANLEGTDGETYGIQYTLFRQAGAPPPERDGWANQQFWLGHIALTTASRHFYAERIARGGIGHAGVRPSPFAAWIDDWQLAASDEAAAETALGFGALRLSARGDDFAYDLGLTTEMPPILQGEAGYSVKSDRGQASYYYSQPYFLAEGTIEIEGRTIPVSGRAWLDREWSSQPLAADQSGWDWFSLHLDETTKMMLFRLRHDDGQHYFSGNWIDGSESTPIPGDQIELEILEETDVAGRTVPTGWRVKVGARGVDVTVAPLNPKAWNGTQIGYWEGPVRGAGSHDAIGYLEITGY